MSEPVEPARDGDVSDPVPEPPRERRGLSPEAITAAAAVFAAVVALSVGVWENIEMRRHQRLSVLPYVDFVQEVTQGDSVNQGGLVLINSGIGPARIDGMRITVHGASPPDSTFAEWSAALSAIEALGASVQSLSNVLPGSMIPAGGAQELIRFAPGDGGQAAVDRVFGALDVTVDYESVYGEPFKATFTGSPIQSD